MSKTGKIWTTVGFCVVLFAILSMVASKYSKGNEEGGDVAGRSLKETAAIDGSDTYIREQDRIMSDMMEAMMAVPKSGSAAINFLTGMIPHHESAVVMSESYLKNGGKQKELKVLAENIIKTQNDEIEQMKTMIGRIEQEGKKDEAAEDAYLEEYNKMMHSSHGSHSVLGTIDQAFAEGMKMHHQMAVDMSEAVLYHTEDEEVQELAQNIINLQKMEIEQMDKILKELGK